MARNRTLAKQIVDAVETAMFNYGDQVTWENPHTHELYKELRGKMRQAVREVLRAQPEWKSPYTPLYPGSRTPAPASSVGERALDNDQSGFAARSRAVTGERATLAAESYIYKRPSPNWAEPVNPVDAPLRALLAALVAEQEMERLRMGLPSTYPRMSVGGQEWDVARAKVVRQKRDAERGIAVALATHRDAVHAYLNVQP